MCWDHRRPGFALRSATALGDLNLEPKATTSPDWPLTLLILCLLDQNQYLTKHPALSEPLHHILTQLAAIHMLNLQRTANQMGPKQAANQKGPERAANKMGLKRMGNQMGPKQTAWD